MVDCFDYAVMPMPVPIRAVMPPAIPGVAAIPSCAEHGLSEGEVTAVLDRAADVWFTGEHLRRELLLEVERLNALERHYYEKALGAGEGATAAGALYVKLQERKSVLIGLNAPAQSAALIIHQSVPAKQVTSTERIRAALDRIVGVTPRERELTDQGARNAEALAELNDLRAQRDKPPLPPS